MVCNITSAINFSPSANQRRVGSSSFFSTETVAIIELAVIFEAMEATWMLEHVELASSTCTISICLHMVNMLGTNGYVIRHKMFRSGREGNG